MILKTINPIGIRWTVIDKFANRVSRTNLDKGYETYGMQ